MVDNKDIQETPAKKTTAKKTTSTQKKGEALAQKSKAPVKKTVPKKSIEKEAKPITTNKKFSPDSLCPCGSGNTLKECCGQYFDGTIPAPTPEALMRARYCAHVTHNHHFLIESTHPKFRDDETEEDITKWVDQVEWKGLHVLTAIGGKNNDTTGSIAFVVNFLVNGFPREMKETAHFVKENGCWYYTEGDVEGHITYERSTPKMGRNDACSCGSGKKYKKCCLNAHK